MKRLLVLLFGNSSFVRTKFNQNAEKKIAPIKSRFFSLIIDGVVLAAYGYLAGMLFGKKEYTESGDFGGYSFYGYKAWIFAIGLFLLFPILEGLTGQTIGKQIVGIEIVSKKTGKHTVIGSIIRHLFSPFEIFIFFFGYIIASANQYKQRIGDFVAGTIVVIK